MPCAMQEQFVPRIPQTRQLVSKGDGIDLPNVLRRRDHRYRKRSAGDFRQQANMLRSLSKISCRKIVVAENEFPFHGVQDNKSQKAKLLDLTLMKRKSLYIFDMDGTLFNTLGDLSVAVNHALAEFGLKTLSTEKIRSYIGNGSLKLVERSLEGADVPLEEVHRCYSEFYAAHCQDATVPYPGVVEFLKNFPAKKALATNKPQAPGIALLKHFGLESCFSAFAFGDTVSERKPAAEPFLKILAKTGVPREEAVMVGDDAPDILGAKNAGIDSVFIENGFGKRSSFAPVEPTYSISDFSDLENLQF